MKSTKETITEKIKSVVWGFVEFCEQNWTDFKEIIYKILKKMLDSNFRNTTGIEDIK